MVNEGWSVVKWIKIPRERVCTCVCEGWCGYPEEREGDLRWGRSGRSRALCKVAPGGTRRCTGPSSRCWCTGPSSRCCSFGPSHKMAAAPLGPSVRDRGAGGRCSRPRRRRQPRTQGQGGQARGEGKTDCRKLEDRKEERVSAGRPRTLKSSRRRVKPGSWTLRGWEVRRQRRPVQWGRAPPPHRGGDGGARAAGKSGGRRAGARERAHAGPGRSLPRRPGFPSSAAVASAPDAVPLERAARGPASCPLGSRAGCRSCLLLVPGPP